MADKPYRDPKTTKIEDWKWRPLEQVKAKLAIAEVPDYIQKGFGGFMNEQAGRSQRGEMTPRDLIKAYTIAQSSIGRGGLSHGTATKTGMRLPNTGGEVRPEGAFAEWLGSPEGQRYLDAAERGTADMTAIGDLQGKFAPFGKHNDQADKMVLAAKMAQLMGPDLNKALTGSADEYRDYAEKMKGIAGAKSGFIGSLLGRGDLPTLDARQLALHALPASVGIGSIMNRGKGKGAREAVDRLSARQRAMRLALDPSLDPHYQHLAHHAVWDKASGTETTHDDLMRAMRGYAQGGDVEPTVHQMRQALAKGGSAKSDPALPLDLPRAPNLTRAQLAPIVERVALQQLGEHVRKPGKTSNLADRSMREVERLKGVGYGLIPTGNVPESKEYQSQIGDINIALPGDQTVSDMYLEHVNGLPIGSQQEGGARYGMGKKGAFWASNEGPASGFQAKVTELARITGEDPRVIAHHMAMGRISNHFAQHFADANLKAIANSKASDEEKEQFNNVIRAGYTKKHPKTGKYITTTFPHFPGIHNPQEAYVALQEDPEMRKWFNNRMKTSNITKALNLPNGLDIEHAITEPALRNMEINLTGHSVGRVKPGASLIPGSKHGTYSHDIVGEALGHAPELSPFEVAFPDATAFVRKEYAPSDFTGTIQKVFPHQIVDENHLQQMHDYYTALRKRRGFAEGGEVKDREPSQDEMMAHIMLKGMSNLKDVGANEAPNLKVKSYVPPAGGPGLPVGGVDFQPEAQGQQMMPGQPPQAGGLPAAPGQPPQAGGPQGGPPPGASGQPPAPAPNAPRSNILQMTPQGQAMAAMKPSGPPGAPPPKMAGGGSTTPSVEEMRRAIASAATSAGMKAPVTANKALTDLNDVYQSLGDDVRKKAADMQDMIESMPFKYEPGHHVFTAHSAKNNLPPFKVIRKALVGNSPMREDHPTLGSNMGKPIKDPLTGKTKRTPYEPGYDVRREHKGEVMEMRIPESAILDKLAAGGTVKDYIRITERKL
jgi:hypothetical protein